MPCITGQGIGGRESAAATAGGLWWHDAHAPNESIRSADYLRGIAFIGRLLERFAAAA